MRRRGATLQAAKDSKAKAAKDAAARETGDASDRRDDRNDD